LMGDKNPDISTGMCNYDVWWHKIQKALDPQGVSPEPGALV